ncbi:MAG: hypothetical protein EXX96DRAFT_619810 [Benjaminiella poitrasii]|nr:MAG: hypothetical protein EXX96DRAFT_619810 [Benjaminiella poitrasii]
MNKTSTTSKWWWRRPSTTNNRNQATTPTIGTNTTPTIDTNTTTPTTPTINTNTTTTPISTSNHGSADEGASMFTLYSYGDSIIAPPSVSNLSNSILVRHTAKSEYSEVASNASILSKPWVSKSVLPQENDPLLIKYDNEFEMPVDSEDDDDDEDQNDPTIITNTATYSTPQSNNSRNLAITTTVTDDNILATDHTLPLPSLTSPSPPPPETTSRRRGSLVDYLINKKPLHGKLKAGFGRFVRNKNYDGEQVPFANTNTAAAATSTTAIPRRSSVY